MTRSRVAAGADFAKTLAPDKAKGFTLLEVIVATIIFAAVISGLSATFISVKRHLLHTKSNIQAVNIARAQLERLPTEIRQDTWDSPANLLTDGNVVSGSLPAMDNSNIPYNYEYTVSDTGMGGLKQVDITVNWNEP